MLLAALLVLTVLLAVMLWTPVDVKLEAKRDPGLQLDVRLSWLFGLLTTELGSGENEPQRARTTRTPVKSKRRGRRSFSAVQRMLRSKGFLSGVARLLRRVVGGIEVRRAELWARAGLDDPADTGRLLGTLYPITRYFQAVSRYHIDIEPDFLRQVFFFHARSDLRIVPFRVIGPALAFALSPATLRAFLVARD